MGAVLLQGSAQRAEWIDAQEPAGLHRHESDRPQPRAESPDGEFFSGQRGNATKIKAPTVNHDCKGLLPISRLTPGHYNKVGCGMKLWHDFFLSANDVIHTFSMVVDSRLTG